VQRRARGRCLDLTVLGLLDTSLPGLTPRRSNAPPRLNTFTPAIWTFHVAELGHGNEGYRGNTEGVPFWTIRRPLSSDRRAPHPKQEDNDGQSTASNLYKSYKTHVVTFTRSHPQTPSTQSPNYNRCHPHVQISSVGGLRMDRPRSSTTEPERGYRIAERDRPYLRLPPLFEAPRRPRRLWEALSHSNDLLQFKRLGRNGVQSAEHRLPEARSDRSRLMEAIGLSTPSAPLERRKQSAKRSSLETQASVPIHGHNLDRWSIIPSSVRPPSHSPRKKKWSNTAIHSSVIFLLIRERSATIGRNVTPIQDG